MTTKNKIILFVVNVDWYFISHRLKIAKTAVDEGYKVYVLAKDTGRRNEIEAVGASFVNINFTRSGTNPIRELLTMMKLLLWYKKLRPDAVHHIAMKPVVYGTIAAKWLKIPAVNAINGLGFVFKDEAVSSSSNLVVLMMRYGFNYDRLVSIFQNKDDKNDLLDLGILKSTDRTVLIKGAGVDLGVFQYCEPVEPKQKLEIVLTARLLWSKGIKEFKEASEILRTEFEDRIKFKLVGMPDQENMEGISEQELKAWNVSDYFEWIPYTTDIVSILKHSDIVVLPSYYREGMPKSLLEACAIGRPVITTTAIGCRECVDEGINGFKIEPRNSKDLAKAIERLVSDKTLRHEMGVKSRAKAEAEFDLDQVIKTHLQIYHELTNG